ncbi:hypothetical protein N431DRAFT_483289 [Stipitochalara longipes BDJ]|nr:hypothetical protein N431DRAFT_483289 [Stipitochalara longipes BDJ]
MFKPPIHPASRLCSRPLRDPNISPLRRYGSRRFFRSLERKAHRARIPLVIAISACTIGAVGLLGLAIDRYGPQGLAPFRTPFLIAKSHVQNVFSRKPDADLEEMIRLPPRPGDWDPYPDRPLSEAEIEQIYRDRQRMREMFKRARASGSQEEMRKACFSVIPHLTGNSNKLEELGPLAPLPSHRRSAGKGAPFDMAIESRLYRILKPDGSLAAVFLAINAELDSPKDGFSYVFGGFINQFEIRRRDRSIRLHPQSFIPVILAIEERVILMQYAHVMKKFSLDAY